MDPAEYLDARWYALLRVAADLGVPEDDAPELVRRVLSENRRRIRRADDPDPLVREALRDAVLGPAERQPGRRRAGLAAVALVLVAVGIGVAVVRPDDLPSDELRDDQSPSLFGYDSEAATALLEERGLMVEVRTVRSCEILGRALASDPPTGAVVERGDPVTVFAAIPADVSCLADYTDRETAWRLLDFANGRGPAPVFADRVFVTPGDGRPVVLDGASASRPEGWDETGVLDGLREASVAVALVTEQPPRYAVPAIRVVPPSDRVGSCGVPDPSVSGAGDAFSMLVRPPGGAGCGVRVDVFRSDGAIEAVAYYPG